MMVHRTPLVALGFLVACASAPTPAPKAPEPVEEPAPPADVEMRHHFWDVAQARDAVIAANLEGVRPPLLRIANAAYGDDMPADWRDWVAEMQEQARAAAQAKTLAEAAQAVAMLSNACGECHRATRGGPQVTDDAPHYRAQGAGLPERMHKHLWAADALWVGLTAKNHQAWSRGARALAELPLPDPALDPNTAQDAENSIGASSDTGGADEKSEEAAAVAKRPQTDGNSPKATADESETPGEEALEELSPFAAKLDAIRLLGQRADQAAQPAEKSAVYGEILTACAGCHAHVRQRQKSASN